MNDAAEVATARGTIAPASPDELRPLKPSGSRDTASLPADIEAQTARRLRIVVALYAFAFFVNSPLTAMLSPSDRAMFLGHADRWMPPVISIGTALLVVAATWSRRMTPRHLLTAGLAFEVAGSFGIATAQYLDVTRYAQAPPWGGLSWVAVWMLGFTTMVPSPPRRALVAALGSAAAVPVTVAFALANASSAPAITPLRFFLQIVLPYLLVVVIAYVGAGVVYRLGTELKRARELGAYRLAERLGFGGMGEVWRAEHRLLVRPAAVKIVRADPRRSSGADIAELHARFEREAQALASLRSPHTIQLYDFGVANDGTFYYVMELLDGFDLQTLVERFGPIPTGRAARLLVQVCHSLAEAHGEGLVHRDIKPPNVFVCRYGRDLDFVKVLDFGLVKPLPTYEQDSGLTAAHSVRGTPAFMPPEQALGLYPIDGRTDIYAVGCLGYWLVTGETVFTGRTAMETLTKHTQEAPTPPSRRATLPVPEDFDRLILGCLEKDPARRPSNALALARQLAPLATANGWSDEHAERWWTEHGPQPRRPPAADHLATPVGMR